jgi:AraC-like DNA-binding protein
MYGLPLERLNSINPIAPEQISTTEQFDSIANGNKFEVSSSSTIQSPLFLFNKEYCDELQFQLEKCINELWFIDTNFKLDSLSKNSGIPLHHWTYYFNEIKKQNFIDWKNSIRIDYAKKMIEEGFLENQTFLSLAALCGYNAKSTFIRAFKIHTGMNPSEFTKTSTS